MSKAILKLTTARKNYTCQTCKLDIISGDKYWALKAFRQKAKFCLNHKPSEQMVRDFGPKSRDDRASVVAGDLRSAAEKAREVMEDITNLLNTEEEGEETEETPEETLEQEEKRYDEEKIKSIKKGYDEIPEPNFSEIGSLAEEMRSWADGMSGTNLENSQKYSDVDECASTLEGLDTSISLPEWIE